MTIWSLCNDPDQAKDSVGHFQLEQQLAPTGTVRTAATSNLCLATSWSAICFPRNDLRAPARLALNQLWASYPL
jgi:hypothetical protein